MVNFVDHFADTKSYDLSIMHNIGFADYEKEDVGSVPVNMDGNYLSVGNQLFSEEDIIEIADYKRNGRLVKMLTTVTGDLWILEGE